MSNKVCFITTVHSPFDTRIFHKEAKSLAQAGYEVILIAQHEQNEVVEGVCIVALPNPRNRFARIFGLTWRAFRLAIQQRARVYHFHDPELLPWGVLLKLITRAKIVYDIHENIPKQILNKSWLPLWSRKFFATFYRLVERASFPFVDAIVLAEDSYEQNYSHFNNMVLVRNYPILSYAKKTFATTDKDEENRGENNFTITYVGGVVTLRGVFEAIEAVKIVKAHGYQRVKLNLIGRIMPPSLKNKLDRSIKEYNLEQSVSVPGPIPHTLVYEVLSRSDVGLVVLHPDPNYVESLPTKLFEYMAVGLPVIASNFPLWKQVVEKNQCGLTVDPLNPEEIAAAIEYLLEHPKQRREMGKNGRRAVLERYNWAREAEELLLLYEELLQ